MDRFDINDGDSVGQAIYLYNGTPDPAASGLAWKDGEGFPFAGIYLSGRRCYDCEVWINGDLRHRVPPRDPLVDEIYGMIEAAFDRENHLTTRARNTPRQLDADEFTKRLEAIRSEVRQHPGTLADYRWRGLARSVNVHRANAVELTSLLDEVGASRDLGIEMFQNTRPPEIRQAIEAAVDQRLHNYVASTTSLIEHARRLMNKYVDSGFFAEYERRRKPISESPAAVFIKDLRNFTTHRELPFVGHVVSLARTEPGPTTSFLLSVSALMEWDGWTAPAKRLLASAGDTVVLRDVVDDHMALVNELYEWVFRQIPDLHRYEFTLLDDLHQEHNWIISGGREGRPRRFKKPGA